MAYTYDAGENWTRRKHAGASDVPEFVGKFGIGKCPKGFPQERAQGVLNHPTTLRLRHAGSPADEADWLFALVDGVLFRAIRTGTRGTSYHAFPECQRKHNQLPAWVKDEVARWATRHQFSKAIKKWLDQTP